MKKTDIDIDVADKKLFVNAGIPHVKASRIDGGKLHPHPVGVYLQDIPRFLDTDFAAFDYKNADQFFKIDILTNSTYKDIDNNEYMEELVDRNPDWSLLLDDDVVKELTQIGSYGEYLKRWKPNSVDELAMFIAMIRPAKFHCLSYDNWEEVKKEIWKIPNNDKAFFKKSHSFAYALSIVVQLNVISDR